MNLKRTLIYLGMSKAVKFKTLKIIKLTLPYVYIENDYSFAKVQT